MFTLASTVTIGFVTGNVTAYEGDGSVTVNLLRTGNHFENINVYISILAIENAAIIKRALIKHNYGLL